MMKKSTTILWATVLFVAGAAMVSIAAVPNTNPEHVPGAMNYQGRLIGSMGNPYADATYTFDIRLYTVANGGTPRWGGTYASFVKDGYFNIMLGGTGGQALAGTAYTHTDLWKALWPDAANGATGDSLYLGVTPWQDENGNPIDASSRTELSPRQTLLTAPYAFRAQTADYANRAGGDFIASGTITAAHITAGDNLIKTEDFWGGGIVNIGGADGAIVENAVNINAYEIDIDAGEGDLSMTSARRIEMNADGNIYMDSKNSLTAKSKSNLEIESTDGAAILKAKSTVRLTSTSGHIILQPTGAVQGHNTLQWSVPGSGNVTAPIRVDRIVVNMPANSMGSVYATDWNYDQFSLMIVGFDWVLGNIPSYGAKKNTATGNWDIYLSRNQSITSQCNVKVDILIINKNWVQDNR